jgi:hypothetical protein
LIWVGFREYAQGAGREGEKGCDDEWSLEGVLEFAAFLETDWWWGFYGTRIN